MPMIDLILKTARRMQLEREATGIGAFHRAYLRDHPNAGVGERADSFAAIVRYHTINLKSRFPDPKDVRARARWLDHPLFKRVGHGQFMLLSEAEIAWFRDALLRDAALVWESNYEVPSQATSCAQPFPRPLVLEVVPSRPALLPRPATSPVTSIESGALDERIQQWLATHDDRLSRFESPLPIDEVAREVGVPVAELRGRLLDGGTPPFHVWFHTHRGKRARTKPYCLRLGGPNTVVIDRESSVVGAVEAAFVSKGFETKRELGTEEHVSILERQPSLAPLTQGSNLRDLWALRRHGAQVDLWILEAKGKQAGGFDHLCVAEAMGQLFPLSAALLMKLGAPPRQGHGLCFDFAKRLESAWRSRGLHPTITLALLLPYWRPDIVWSNGRARPTAASYFDRPVRALQGFLRGGDSKARTGTQQYERVFGSIMEEIDLSSGLRALASATEGIRFRLMLAGSAPSDGFQVLGLEEISPGHA